VRKVGLRRIAPTLKTDSPNFLGKGRTAGMASDVC